MAQAKDDCEELMQSLLPVAEKLLREFGEFYPFGGGMRPSGEIVQVSTYDGNEHPASVDKISDLKKVFVDAARNAEYKATGIVYDVRVFDPSTGEKSDAVACAVDHRDQYSVVVYLPYRIDAGELHFGTTFAQAGKADIFLGE